MTHGQIIGKINILKWTEHLKFDYFKISFDIRELEEMSHDKLVFIEPKVVCADCKAVMLNLN